MRYAPFIIISLILYTLFFYNNQDPELLIINNDSSEKIVSIDFNLSGELKEQTTLKEKPSQDIKAQLDEHQVLEAGQQLPVTALVTSGVTENTTTVIPVQTSPTIKNSTKPLDLPTEPNTRIEKVIPVDKSTHSTTASDSALLKGEFYQQTILVNLPPLPVKKKISTPKQIKREAKQASVSAKSPQNNTSLKVKQPPSFKVNKQSEKPKRTFKKQIKTMPHIAIPGLQIAIAVSGNTPQYPVQAKVDKLQGTVTAKFIVNIQGKTKNSQVIYSSSHKVLDDALLEFVNKERFMPALDGIDKITSEQQLSFKYEIK